MTGAAQLRIDQARWWALTNQPFYGSLAMNLADVLDNSTSTASTNGRVINWNPEFVDTLSDPELRFVLLHEALHCAHQHLWRLPANSKGNEAGDREINLTLATVPGIEMPQGGLADPQFQGLSCEEILGRLGDEDESPSGQPDSGDGQSSGNQSGSDPAGGQPDPCGSFTQPATDPTPADGGDGGEQELRDEWAGQVIQASQAAQALGQGTIPGDMDRLLKRMRQQDVDWRREMADFVKDAMSTRNDWSRSARRHACQPVIYPRRRVDSLGTVIFARDTSGSINDEICAEFSALISDCVSEMGCEGLVIDCDSRIQAEYSIANGDECPLTAKGGGGTDFRPVFDRADELVALGEQVAGIVYLTDLYGSAPESSEIPTLWVATSDRQPAFGRAVRVSVD